MNNLENYRVMELRSNEMEEVDGGGHRSFGDLWDVFWGYVGDRIDEEEDPCAENYRLCMTEGGVYR